MTKALGRFMFLFCVLLLTYSVWAGSPNDWEWNRTISGKYKQGKSNMQFSPQEENERGFPVSDQTVHMELQDGRSRRAPNNPASAEHLQADRSNINPVVAASSYAVYQSEYKISVDEELAFVKGEVTLEVFGKGGVIEIPLVSSQVGLRDVALNQRPCFVTRKNEKYYIRINKEGQYVLEFEFFMKVARERERGPGSFSCDVVSSPISILNIEIKQSDVEIFAEPSIKVESKREKDRTLAVAILPYTERVNLRWSKTVVQEKLPDVKLDPKIYAETSTLVSLGEGVARCKSTVNFSILQSEVANLKLFFPEDVGILDVVSDNLRNWKITKVDNGQVLDVYLNYGAKGSHTLQVEYERTTGSGSVTTQIPAMKVLGAEREKGFIGLQAQANIEINLNKLEGASSVDVKELPRMIWSAADNPILLGFKYLEYPYGITVDIIKHSEEPVLVGVIDQADYTTLVTKEGKVLTKVVYVVRNNVKQFLKLVLPKGANFWSCFIDGAPVKPGRDKSGHILIPLKKSQKDSADLSQFTVEAVYLNVSPRLALFGGVVLNLPTLDLPQSELFWTLYLPDNKSYFWFRGDVEQVSRRSVPSRAYPAISKSYEKKLQVSEYAQKDEYVQPQNTVVAVDQSFQRVAGVLPLKIEIPQKGRVFQFRKLLITDESPHLSVRYVTQVLKSTLVILAFVAGILVLIHLPIFHAKKNTTEG